MENIDDMRKSKIFSADPPSNRPNLQQRTPSLKPSPSAALLIALREYSSGYDNELRFYKDDTFYLIDDKSPDWWYVQNTKTGNQGFILREYIAKVQEATDNETWYAGKLERNWAKHRVLQPSLPQGSYLIRERENSDECVLTIRDGDDDQPSAHKYIIGRTPNGGFFITSSSIFVTLRDLVSHYTRTHDVSACSGQTLTVAAPPCSPPKTLPAARRRWEISHAELEIKGILGDGHYSIVWLGKWNNEIDVAVKQRKRKNGEWSMSAERFLEEAAIMKKCSHPNLVRLYAVCPGADPLIVLEFMPNKSLLDYLRLRANQHLIVESKKTTLVNFALQVASGMSYLAEHNVVHRDLAARNVLVAELDPVSGIPVVKIADFGLTRALHKSVSGYTSKTSELPLPQKTMAPEAQHGYCTTKSDVWSYGILLNEIFTGGFMLPPGYPTLDRVGRYGMKRPLYCPAAIYNIMLNCWEADAEKRVTFNQLYNFFLTYTTEGERAFITMFTSSDVKSYE